MTKKNKEKLEQSATLVPCLSPRKKGDFLL